MVREVLRRGIAVFVVSDVARPPPIIKWTAMLCGAAVLVPGVLKGDRPGPIVTYQSAFTLARQVVISARFQAQHPGQASILKHAVAAGQNQMMRWTLLAGSADFQAAKREANRTKQRSRDLPLHR